MEPSQLLSSQHRHSLRQTLTRSPGLGLVSHLRVSPLTRSLLRMDGHMTTEMHHTEKLGGIGVSLLQFDVEGLSGFIDAKLLGAYLCYIGFCWIRNVPTPGIARDSAFLSNTAISSTASTLTKRVPSIVN